MFVGIVIGERGLLARRNGNVGRGKRWNGLYEDMIDSFFVKKRRGFFKDNVSGEKTVKVGFVMVVEMKIK